jgi:hypothetical protein
VSATIAWHTLQRPSTPSDPGGSKWRTTKIYVRVPGCARLTSGNLLHLYATAEGHLLAHGLSSRCIFTPCSKSQPTVLVSPTLIPSPGPPSSHRICRSQHSGIIIHHIWAFVTIALSSLSAHLVILCRRFMFRSVLVCNYNLSSTYIAPW